MQKIDFVNAQQPAINDTNLNQMQLNIENAINAQVAGDTLPVGCIVPFTSDTVPENWLLCDGQAVSRTTYALLFSIIGTTYGVGDGSTTFNLPNLKGKVPVGYDSTQTEFDTLGETGGEKTHTQTVAEMPSHYHSQSLQGGSSGNPGGNAGYNWSVPTNQYFYGGDDLATRTGNGQPMNNLQPYIVTNYIIKAQQSAGIVATVVDNLTSTSATNALSAKQGKILGGYSTSETVVGTWIDGKPLYRKIVTATAPEGDVTNFGIPHGISNLKTVIHQELNATNSNGNTYPQDNDIYVLKLKDTDAQNVWCNVSGAFYTWTLIVTLEYTKTTD